MTGCVNVQSRKKGPRAPSGLPEGNDKQKFTASKFLKTSEEVDVESAPSVSERNGLLPKCEDLHFPTTAWITIYLLSTFALLTMNWFMDHVNLRLSSSIVFWVVLMVLTGSALVAELQELERTSKKLSLPSKTISLLSTPKEDTHYAA